MKLAAVGDNCMDVYDNIGQEFAGGCPVNVSVYFVRLGGEASYIGAVGSDAYGKIMQDSISAKGVDISHVHVLDGSTAITHVELIDGERVFGEYDEGVLADFKLSGEDKEFICGHDMLVTSLWGNIHEELANLHARGVRIAYDSADRPDDPATEVAIPSVDYLFFASDDGDTEELRELMKELYAKGPELVIATLGEKGSIAYDGREFTVFGIVPCHVVDTMGAGDSFIAGFLKGILEKKAIEECMKMGASNSSLTLEYRGAW